MTFKEIYQESNEIRNSKEFSSLFEKSKNNTITDIELKRFDDLVSRGLLKTELDSKISDLLFKKNRTFLLNNGAILKITKNSPYENDVCFKVSNETKSKKLDVKGLVNRLYGLYREPHNEYISDEFIVECDAIVSLENYLLKKRNDGNKNF